MPSIQDLDGRFQIVNPDGTPTEYLLRLLNDRGDSQVDDQETIDLLETTKADKDILLTAGFGLSGGGDLSASRTFDLDAALDDLSDVDVGSAADGDSLVYDSGTATWGPVAVSGGGGGSGTSFPGSPSDGEKFYRTDLHMEFFWDDTNSQWLSVTLYTLNFSNIINTGTDAQAYSTVPFKGVFGIWIESLNCSAYRTGAGEWDIHLRWRDNANAATTLVSIDGASRTANLWYYDDVSVDVVLDTGAYIIDLMTDEISGSAFSYLAGVMHYRLIAT